MLTNKLVCLLKGHNYRRIVKGDSTYSICLRCGKLVVEAYARQDRNPQAHGEDTGLARRAALPRNCICFAKSEFPG